MYLDIEVKCLSVSLSLVQMKKCVRDVKSGTTSIAAVTKNAGLVVTSVGDGGITGVPAFQKCQTPHWKKTHGNVQYAETSDIYTYHTFISHDISLICCLMLTSHSY